VTASPSQDAETERTSLTVEVRFKGTRKGYFLWPSDAEPLRVRDAVIVQAERGRDLGFVTAAGEVADKKCASACAGCAVGAASQPEPPSKPVIRRATPDDLRTHREVRGTEEEARRTVVQRVRAHELIMKVSDCEWQWDRQKLTIYFTAEKRVDFRALVRDLASLFRTRIELRQIGVRDEAAQLTGVGRCGREYCCSTWLTELLMLIVTSGWRTKRPRKAASIVVASSPAVLPRASIVPISGIEMRPLASTCSSRLRSGTLNTSTWIVSSGPINAGRSAAVRSCRCGAGRIWLSGSTVR